MSSLTIPVLRRRGLAGLWLLLLVATACGDGAGPAQDLTEVLRGDPGEVLWDANVRFALAYRPGTRDVRLYDRLARRWIAVGRAPEGLGNEGRLTPSSALVLTEGGGGATLFEWRGPMSVVLGPAVPGTLAAAGDFAIWHDGTTLRRIGPTGGAEPVTDSATADAGAGVAPNGEVVFTARRPPQNVVRVRGGVAEAITTDTLGFPGVRGHGRARTDGTHVLFRTLSFNGIETVHCDRLHLPSGDTATLSCMFTDQPLAPALLRDGWAAYEVRPPQQRTAAVRSPGGQETVLAPTVAGDVVRLEALGPGGDLVVKEGPFPTGASRRIRHRQGRAPEAIETTLGTPIWIEGVLHLLSGEILYRVD